MSDRPGGRNLAAVLGVRRRAAVGFGGGAAFAAVLYLFFVVAPGAPHRFRYLVLAFVVAVTTGLLFTAVLVARAAYRVADAE